MQEALVRYRQDVEARAFPTATHSPYKIARLQREEVVRQARDAGFEAAAVALESCGEDA